MQVYNIVETVQLHCMEVDDAQFFKCMHYIYQNQVYVVVKHTSTKLKSLKPGRLIFFTGVDLGLKSITKHLIQSPFAKN